MPNWSRVLSLLVILGLLLGSAASPAQAISSKQADGPTIPRSPYFSVETTILADGTSLDATIINGPPNPPPGYEWSRQSVSLPGPDQAAASATLDVPAYDWVYGCSAVSAAMIAGYYDRNGFPNLYTGPTAGGVMPLTNASWPGWTDSYGGSYPQNPLIASRNGLDGRGTRGSLDDYWVALNSGIMDPYLNNGWAQHSWGDAIGDYMKTSQSVYENIDGSTKFYNYTSYEGRLTCGEMLSENIAQFDGTYGRKLFYEAKGYTVTDCYNQKTDNTIAGGFTFADYKAEIDAGHPVLLNLNGHSIVGVGYNDTGSTVYIHDTWDAATHQMTWGGSYAGMGLLSVSIVNIQPPVLPGGFARLGPGNGAGTQPTNPTLSWEASSDATGYQYCYDDSNDNACSTWRDAGMSTSAQLSGLEPAKDYYWHVRANNTVGSTYANGGETYYWRFTTRALNMPPNTPGTPAPGNGAGNILLNTGLSWSGGDPDAGDSVTYDVYLQAGVNPPTLLISDNQTGTSLSPGLLESGTQYFWQVIATDSDNASTSGPVWSFTTKALPGTFQKSNPANGATGQPLSPTLTWTASGGADSYEYCYDTTNDNACTSWQSANTATSTVLGGLSYATTYYWQARATNTAGATYANGSQTAYRSFTTQAAPPQPPASFGKTGPDQGDSGLEPGLTLSWQATTPVTRYEYCLDTTDDNLCSAWLDAGTNTSVPVSGLEFDTTYFWQVRAWNDSAGPVYANGGSWWSFQVKSQIGPNAPKVIYLPLVVQLDD